MDRKEELLNIIEHDPALIPLVDEMVYLEDELEKLRQSRSIYSLERIQFRVDKQ